MSIPAPKLTKAERALLAELAEQAYNDELTELLTELYEDFCKWGGDGISAIDLVDRIHDFHDGSSRALYKRFNALKPHEVISQEIASGRMGEEAIPASLREKLQPLIDALRSIAS